MRVQKTWNDNLNVVIRDVVFPDEEMKTLLMIPETDRNDILKFIDKYFVKNVISDEIVTDENVRICYYEQEGVSLGMNCSIKYLYFDIYVKNEHLHDYGDDLLAARTELIAQKLKELLTTDKYVCRINFSYRGGWDMYCKTVGYKRYTVVFSYKTTW